MRKKKSPTRKAAGKTPHERGPFSKGKSEVLVESKESVTGCFDDKELLYLAALMRGSMSLDELTYATSIDTKEGFTTLEDLQTTGLVHRGEKKGKSPREYSITVKGKKIVGTLREEERFLEIQKQIK